MIKKGTKKRQFLGPPIGTKKTLFCIAHQRVQCSQCQVIKYLPLKFIPRPKVRYTRSLEQYVLSLSITLIRHKEGILAYYTEKMTSGKVESVNNRTKTLSKLAYGYRDWEFFELKIKSAHEGRYSFSG